MKQILFVALLLATLTLTAQCPSYEPKEQRFTLDNTLVEQEMMALSQQTTIPLHYNSQINNFISLYVNNRNKQTNAMLQRSYMYFPIIEAGLRQYGLPDELKYLVMVESAMNPTAAARDGKKGLWQLSPTLAKRYDLTINDEINECFDPELSTEIACKCLGQLFNRYDDWLLAITAYNLGAAYVDRAIEAAEGSKDYWILQQHLPIEVRGYIPAYMAIVYIMSRPEQYGLYPVCPVNVWLDTETVKLAEPMTFDQIENRLGITMETLTKFNPKYVNKTIPASSESPQSIRLPKEMVAQFKQTFKTT